jgi:TetR/AcrR family transcriptional regulator, transcriptional repressor of aconitase
MPKISQTLKDNRREAILQAAVDCLQKHGLAGTSMRTIAEAVGLTKGGLYPYFENKEAILLAVAERYLERHLTSLEPREGMDAAGHLAQFLDDFMLGMLDPATAEAQRGVLELWFSADEIPSMRDFMAKRYDAIVESLAELIRRGQDGGLLRRDVSAEHVAGVILAARDGLVSQRSKIRADLPVEGMARVLHAMVMELLLLPGVPSDAPESRSRQTAGAM